MKNNNGLTWDREYELDYETSWGKMEKICYLNGISMRKAREYVKPSKSLGQDIFSQRSTPFDWYSFWRRYIYSSKLKYCPICMSYGYHSVLHQFSFMDTCFIHSCALVEVDDINYSSSHKDMKAGYHYSYLEKQPRLTDIMDSERYLSKKIKEKTALFWDIRFIHPHILFPRKDSYVKNKKSKDVLSTLAAGRIPENPLLKCSFNSFGGKSRHLVKELMKKEVYMPQYASYLKIYGFEKTLEYIETLFFNNKNATCHFTFIYVRQLYFDMFYHKREDNNEWINSMVYGKQDIPEYLIESVLDFLTFCSLFDTVDKDFIEKTDCITWTYDTKVLQNPFGIKLYGIEYLASDTRKKNYFYITQMLIDRLFVQIKEQIRQQLKVTGEIIPRIECNYEINVPEYIFAEGNKMSYLYECMPE